MGAARLRISSFPQIGEGADARAWDGPAPMVQASASSHFDPPSAVLDGLVPANSADRSIPRFVWPQRRRRPRRGGVRRMDRVPLLRSRARSDRRRSTGRRMRQPRMRPAVFLVARVVGRFGVEARGRRRGVSRGERQIQPGSLYARSHDRHPAAGGGHKAASRRASWSGAWRNSPGRDHLSPRWNLSVLTMPEPSLMITNWSAATFLTVSAAPFGQ